MLCFNDTATTESYTLSLHDALPICAGPAVGDWVALRGELAVAILPRRTAFTRVVAGRASADPGVAANLDTGLVVDAPAGAPRPGRGARGLGGGGGGGGAPGGGPPPAGPWAAR